MRMLGFVRSNFSRAVTNNTKYNAKREGTHKINKYGFGEQIHWFRVDRWPIRAKKYAVSKGIRVGVAWVINYLQPTYLRLWIVLRFFFTQKLTRLFLDI